MPKRNNLFVSLDWISVLIYFVLVFFGWINIYSSVYSPEKSELFDFSLRHGKQFMWIIAAVVLAVVVLIVDAKFYAIFSYIIYGLVIFLLIVVLVFGKEVNGAKSWLQFGGFGLQPAEFAKLATALAIAKFLSSYNFKSNSLKHWVILVGLLFVPMAMILLQNDTGSALVFFAFVLVMFREGMPGSILILGAYFVLLFVVSLLFTKLTLIISLLVLSFVFFYLLIRNKRELGIYAMVNIIAIGLLLILNEILSWNLSYYLLIAISLGLSVPVLVYRSIRFKFIRGVIVGAILVSSVAVNYSVDYVFHNVLEEHHQRRINDLLGIESDPLGWGYNVNQSKIAIGSGGFQGKGFLNGTQTKFKFVPEQSTDFIFCTVGEEWGFVGTSLVIVVFVALLLRLIYLAERQRSSFSRIYIYGVASIIFFHFFVNIGMTIGIVPVIGIPLPFFSYGGSSLWGFTLLLFIALKLDTARKEIVM